MLNRIKKRLALETKLFSIRKRKKTFALGEQFYLFSDPRGGSTWLAELLKNIPKTALLWEPLQPNYVKEWQALNFSYRQYIPKGLDWPEAKAVFDKIHRGHVINEWTCLKTTATEYKNTDQLIIKYCRGNALLPWFCEQYNFKYQPIHLIRHPFAVVASQLKQGGWDYTFSGFQIPRNSPHIHHYLEHEDFLNSLESKEEALTATWCLTNNIPMGEIEKKWMEIYYEHLLIDPEKELNRIFDQWQLTIPESLYTQIRTASSTTVGNRKQIEVKHQLSSWRNKLSKYQISRMSRVLEYFGIDTYSADSELPKI